MGDGGAQDQEISSHSSEQQRPAMGTHSSPVCLQVISKGFPEGGDGQVRAGVSEHPRHASLGRCKQAFVSQLSEVVRIRTRCHGSHGT